jgi:response regulator NasT
MRVLLVEDTDRDIGLLRNALATDGHDVVIRAGGALDLLASVRDAQPDVVIIDTDSPSRDVLEQLCIVSRDVPRPIVMFTDDGERESIEAALEAGVTAYIVEGLQPNRVRPILEVAQARFAADRVLRDELDAMRSKLASRKLIERAKGVLMESRKLDEEGAYRMLRRLAMDRQTTIAAVAQQVIDARKLLG